MQKPRLSSSIIKTLIDYFVLGATTQVYGLRSMTYIYGVDL